MAKALCVCVCVLNTSLPFSFNYYKAKNQLDTSKGELKPTYRFFYTLEKACLRYFS